MTIYGRDNNLVRSTLIVLPKIIVEVEKSLNDRTTNTSPIIIQRSESKKKFTSNEKRDNTPEFRFLPKMSLTLIGNVNYQLPGRF